MVLGVGDAKMGAAVLEELGVQCQTGGVVAELMRGEWGHGGHLGGLPVQPAGLRSGLDPLPWLGGVPAAARGGGTAVAPW